MERFITIPLMILYYGIGFWGFYLIEQYLYNEFGLVAAVVAVFVFPLGYVVTPLYAGFSDGYWLPAMVAYAPIALYFAVVLLTIAYDSITSRNS
jgi:hypothetical protein